jgi:tetratricopeptide (TPR) repeat protein
MSQQSLTPAQAQQLQQAHQLMQQGRADDGLRLVDIVLAAAPKQVDALHLKALILKAKDELTAAESFFKRALRQVPNHPHILNNYATLLSDMGKNASALKILRALVTAVPDYADAWLNLGLTALELDQNDVALQALTNATTLAPDNSDAWCGLGIAQRNMDEKNAAQTSFERALRLSPKNAKARFNLSTVLRDRDEPQQALAEIDMTMKSGLNTAEAYGARGHILGDLGDFESAVASYEQALKLKPDYAEVHDALARLLPQLGAQDRMLDSYKQALAANPGSKTLWQAALGSARELKQFEQLLEWSLEATRLFGNSLDLDIARCVALTKLGALDDARRGLLALTAQHPDNTTVHNVLTHVLLSLDAPDEAERHAMRATELTPVDQSGWAYLTLIWRLLENPREHWLADYENLVMPIDIEKPPGFSDMAAYLLELSNFLTGLHQTRMAPAEQSLRGGTQTRGTLFDKMAPILKSLTEQIKIQVADRLKKLPDDPVHPFLRRKPANGSVQFTGSWSVQLQSAGFHINHMHPMGWISSAFYASLPPEVAGSTSAGALAFGVPDSSLGITLPARRIVAPQPGRLVIFPSYFWHGTIPFASSAPRLTVAFDAVPLVPVQR